MRFLLDTNAIIDLLRQSDGSVLRRLRSHDPSEIGLSVIGLHELYFGAFRGNRWERNVSLVDGLRFEVVEFDSEDARHAGAIRADLTKWGRAIGPYDILIAGQARARNLTLVTANAGEFQRVDGLSIDDWSRA